MCPHRVAVLKLKNRWIPKLGISTFSSNVIVSIANHSHIVFAWESRGITTIKYHHGSLLCTVYGDKSDDTAFVSKYVIISDDVQKWWRDASSPQILSRSQYMKTDTCACTYTVANHFIPLSKRDVCIHAGIQNWEY